MYDACDPLLMLRHAASAREAAGPRRAQALAGHGVPAGCFRPPSVPAGRPCLRLAARATLTERDFAALSRALAAVRHHVQTHAPAVRRTR